MKSICLFGVPGRFPILLAGLFRLALAQSATVTVCDEPSLRSAVAGGGVVMVACGGTILLSDSLIISSDVSIQGTGFDVVLSGNHEGRVLEVAPGVRLSLTDLTIRAGASTNGGGLYNDGGHVTLNGVKFAENSARPVRFTFPPASVMGGALFNLGNVEASNCVFLANSAIHFTSGGEGPGAPARGGALYNGPTGTVTLTACQLATNSAVGGWGGAIGAASAPPGFEGSGGAIFNEGRLTILRSTIAGNRTRGGDGGSLGGPLAGAHGGSGGSGVGGGLCNRGQALLMEVALHGNEAAGGVGLAGAMGSNSGQWGSGAGGPGGGGGAGGRAAGAGVFNEGAIDLIASAVAEHRLRGGDGGAGGTGGAGGDPGDGGLGGNGGGAFGSGLFDGNGGLHATNCTVALNEAVGGRGGRGGDAGSNGLLPGSLGADGGRGGQGGVAAGGGWRVEGQGSSTLSAGTIASNRVEGGAGNVGGLASCGRPPNPCGTAGAGGANGAASGGGISLEASSMVLVHQSIIAHSLGAPDCAGALIDGDYNLCSDASADFTSPGSLNEVNPHLGALSHNGGPTLTLSPLAGSPVIDAGDDLNTPARDQRGVPRPQGPRPDIGAVEATLLTVEGLANGSVRLRYGGVPGVGYSLESRDDFGLPWTFVETRVAGEGGAVLFADLPASGAARYFRVVVP